MKMRLVCVLLILATCEAALAQSITPAGKSTATPNVSKSGQVATSPLAARMDQVVRYYADDGLLNGTVAVARNGKLIFSKAYGYANPEWKVPNTIQTRLRIGSLTKQFTAAGILMLEDRGQLSVTDPLKKYLPNIPPSWDKITLHQLLTHTSGITTYTLARHPWPKYQPFNVDKLIEFLKDTPLDFPPGSDYRYDNSGYYLLGAVIEKISGQTYEKFIADNIFTPLGMINTGYDHFTTFIERRAAGFDRKGVGEYADAEYVDMSVPYAAGALYSSAEDLQLWEYALYSAKLFSAAELAKMTTAQTRGVMQKDWGYEYGYGIMVGSDHNRKLYHHTGGIDGFAAYLIYYPEEKLGVSVLTNMTGSKHTKVGDLLAALALGDTIKQPKAVPVAVNVLQSYVGAYGEAGKPGVRITLKDGRLIAKIGQHGTTYLLAESSTKFLDKASGAEVVFTPGQGSATQLAVLQDGKEVAYPRLAN